MNKVILLGRTGGEIDLHYFESGNCNGKVSMATSRKWKNKQTGETVEATEWHNLVIYNKRAEAFKKYAGKGSQILVEGDIRYRSYETQDGTKKYITEIHVFDFTFLDLKSPDGSDQKTQSQGSAAPPLEEEEDDDLPF